MEELDCPKLDPPEREASLSVDKSEEVGKTEVAKQNVSSLFNGKSKRR